jgi:endonuclease/exonuclease/phosphatase family metal-dependent hydrolase
MARAYFNVASFNVKNLVLPGITYYGRNRYSDGKYDDKLTWLAEQLFRMDADIVCLQEVFHEEALQDLVDRYHGLLDARHSAHKARLDQYDNVFFQPNMDGVHTNPQPGLAILSRRDILEQDHVQDLTQNPIDLPESDGFSYRLTKASRPIQMAKIDLGKGVSGWVFNAHLKSKRPKYPSGDPASDQENALFFDRSKAVFRSLALRAGEALALRREILAKTEGSTDPTIVVGDLNDEIGAVTTEIVGGEVPWRAWSGDLKAKYWDVELYSAARSHMRRSEHASLHTHIYNGHYGTIDHILVSQELYYRNRDRIGDVHFVQCFNDHLSDDSLQGAPSIGDASDHGQLVVRMSIDDERLTN